MKKERANTTIVLIDIQYEGSLNSFECEYGDNVTYQEMEQRSYIEFKELLFTNLCKDIKFRKYGRIGQVLTIKADMLSFEIDKLLKMISENEVKLMHNSYKIWHLFPNCSIHRKNPSSHEYSYV